MLTKTIVASEDDNVFVGKHQMQTTEGKFTLVLRLMAGLELGLKSSALVEISVRITIN